VLAREVGESRAASLKPTGLDIYEYIGETR
jgi:hypothetical protein